MIVIGMDCQEYRSQVISTYFNDHWLVVWNINGLFFHLLGISSSQLTFTPSFFRGVGWNHQPDQKNKNRHRHRLSVGCRQANLSIMTGARFSGVIGERRWVPTVPRLSPCRSSCHWLLQLISCWFSVPRFTVSYCIYIVQHRNRWYFFSDQFQVCWCANAPRKHGSIPHKAIFEVGAKIWIPRPELGFQTVYINGYIHNDPLESVPGNICTQKNSHCNCYVFLYPGLFNIHFPSFYTYMLAGDIIYILYYIYMYL